MRIVEALEGKGMRVPLMKSEVELSEKLSSIVRQVGYFRLPCAFISFQWKLSVPYVTLQLKGPAAELPKRVHNLLSITRVNANVGVGSTYLPASAIIDEQSLANMQEVIKMPLFFRLLIVSTFMLKQFQRMCHYVATGTTKGNGSNYQVSKCTEEGYKGCGDNNV